MERPDVTEIRAYLQDGMLHCADMRFANRLYCVLLVGLGAKHEQVAEWLGLSVSTIERWVLRYVESGVDGLREQKKCGRPKKLNIEQLKLLSLDAACHPRTAGYFQEKWNGQLLQYHIHRKYGKDLSLRQCQRILHDLRK